MPVFAVSLPSISAAAAAGVLALTPSLPLVAVAATLAAAGRALPAETRRTRDDCSSRTLPTKRGLFGSRETLRKRSRAPLPPRLAASRNLPASSTIVRLNRFGSGGGVTLVASLVL